MLCKIPVSQKVYFVNENGRNDLGLFKSGARSLKGSTMQYTKYNTPSACVVPECLQLGVWLRLRFHPKQVASVSGVLRAGNEGQLQKNYETHEHRKYHQVAKLKAKQTLHTTQEKRALVSKYYYIIGN